MIISIRKNGALLCLVVQPDISSTPQQLPTSAPNYPATQIGALAPQSFRTTGVCSYVQKHVIDALEGFSQFLANEVSKVRNIVFVIVFNFGFINCNVVLLDANTAIFSSTSLALTALIFTLSTYIGIVIVNSVLCRKKP